MSFGNAVSHSHRRTRRRWSPNIQSKTYYLPSERRRINEGLVFTLEPFLSLGAEWAVDGDDGWTLYADRPAPTVQYEHTLVATKRGAVVVTMA